MSQICRVPFCLVLIALFSLTAVSGPVMQEESGEKAAKEEPEKKAPDPKELERKVEKATRELELARIELQITELSSRIELDASRASVRKETRSHEEAKMDLEHFLAHTRPVTLEKAKIKLDRASNQADHARDELEELQAMYDAEEFAEMTKELVLKRGRRNLELAERDLAVEKRSFDMVEKHDLPKEQRELEEGVKAAGEELEAAQLGLQKQELSSQVALTRARHKIDDLEHDLVEARQELDKVVTPVAQ
ncbi:MAG: hypothetical protein V2A76_06025 [Planctomycetota bacterium]